MQEKRGRRSKALGALPNVTEIPRPPDPPTILDKLGQQRWRDIVSEHSADRFRKSDLQLLEQLVRCEQLTAEMDRNIENHGQVIGGSKGTPVENPAVRVRDKLLRQMVTLQVKLRLCPSTRMRADTGSLGRTQKAKRPWQK